MSELVMVSWAFVVFIVLLNGCAAGIAALFHTRRSEMRRGSKIVGAILGTGLITAGMIGPWTIEGMAEGEGPLIPLLVLILIMVVAMVVSVPGAVIITRRLEVPGDEFRTFE